MNRGKTTFRFFLNDPLKLGNLGPRNDSTSSPEKNTTKVYPTAFMCKVIKNLTSVKYKVHTNVLQ